MDHAATKATQEQLEAVNRRLKRGEGWIGYRNIGRHADGSKKESSFLYYAFYRHGEQVPVNTKTNDVEDAYKQLLDARGLVQRGTLVLPTEAARITYKQMKEAYLKADVKHNREKWAPLDEYFGNLRAVQIDSDAILDYIDQRREEVTDPTIRRELVPLRAMFNLMRKFKKLSADQIPHFPMPEDSLPAGTYITPEQFQQVLDALPKNLVRFFTFMYGTGCRLSATQKITWEMVSQDCSVITLPPGFIKNRQPLTIAIAGAFLEPVRKELQKMFRRKSHPVFDFTNYRNEWNKACAKVGIGTWDKKTRTRTGARIHDCRCSGAINLLEGNVDEGTVLKIGGWRSRVMLDRYNVTSVARLTAAMEKGGKYITDRIKVAETGTAR
jgi:integrase